MIELVGLHRTYVVGGSPVHALNDINLEIKEGDFVAIMGPSGCGKSTLLNTIGLLDSPTKGSYKFLGEETAKKSERRLSEIRKKNIGFIFQSFNLIDELSVRENVELALLYQGIPAGQRRKMVKAVLEKMNIAHRAKHMPQQLSGGQQQRVAVARAVVGQPKMILADEPTGNLDSKHGEEVMQMLTDLNNDGATIIMVTHSPSHADYARRVVNLLDGHIVTENRVAA